MCKGSLIVLALPDGSCIPVAMRRGFRGGSDWTRGGEAAKGQIEKRLEKAEAVTVSAALKTLGVKDKLGLTLGNASRFVVKCIHFENGKPK